MPPAPGPEAVLGEARGALARGLAAIEALTGDLDEATWRARPAPDEWSPLEIICHLRDEEAEDFGARTRLILEGGARFAPIDPPRWAVERRYLDQAPGAALGAFTARRRASLEWLADVDAGALGRSVEHRTAGRLSGLDLLAAWVAHDRLHLAQLAGTLARLWAARWAPLRSDYAGPIPYGGNDGE